MKETPATINVKAVKEIQVMTPRLQKRKKLWEEGSATVSAESSVNFTEAWLKTEGLPVNLRWAKAFAERMAKSAPVIREDELIVGSMTKYVKGVDIIAAFKPNQVVNMIKSGKLESRMRDGVVTGIEEDAKEALLADAEYWADHMPPDYITNAVREELGEDHMDLLADRARVIEGFFERAEPERGLFQGFGAWVDRPVPSKYAIDLGLGTVIAKAKAEIARVEEVGGGQENDDYEKHVLLRAIIISCEAIIDWTHRHADLALEMAAKESNPTRKAELEKIAEVCNWVPENKPRNTWEAIQSFRFLHLAIKKEQPERPEDLGRLDQILYPYYEADIKAGRTTPQETAELLGCLWLKTRESEILESVKEGMRITPGSLLPHITISGLDEKGNDVTNEVSWIILEVLEQLRLPEPSVYVRCHKDMDKDFLCRAIEVNRTMGGGNPAFFNDKLGTDRWLHQGVAPEDACNWWATGCLAARLGIDEMDGSAGSLNHCKILELTFNNGFDPNTKKQLGPKTGDPHSFTSLEDFYKAYFAQVDYFALEARKDYFVRRSVAGQHAPSSGLAAALNEDSITTGRGNLGGGARYKASSTFKFGDRGITDVSDCFASIKKLVFEEKKLTIDELLDAMTSNWEDKDDIRQMCLSVPKYGNDDSYVDDIFVYLSTETQKIMQSRPCPITGRKPMLIKGAASGHLINGLVVGALPNGRKAGSPINDAGTSPMAGMDVNGPTANINSATKLPNTEDYIGIVHNMKFPKELLSSLDKIEKVAGLILAYIEQGGWHIQFNIQSQEELLDARKNPNDHRNLVVRVAGYSAFFVDLPPALQDEIVQRTNQTV